MGQCFLYKRGNGRSGGGGGGITGVEATAIGSVLSLTNSLEKPLKGLRIFGRTTQNGTPTPDAPVALVSAGDSGSITVSVDDQNLVVSTPNGLPGIPVASGGNYTDASGLQWVCDEIDFGRAVRVQRLLYTVFGSASGWLQSGTNDSAEKRFQNKQFTSILKHAPTNQTKSVALCSCLPIVTAERTYYKTLGIGIDVNGVIVAYLPNMSSNVNNLGAFFAANPTVFVAELETPIETPLSAEELAAYAALHTNYPNTTIYNDGGAEMEVKYMSIGG